MKYIDLDMRFLSTAILSTPLIISVSTRSVSLEFQSANGSVNSYLLQYALEKLGSSLAFVNGGTMRAVNGQSAYRVAQTDLLPGRKYHLRVIPQVYVKYNNYWGIPSEAVQVTILKPGKHTMLIRRHQNLSK